MPTPSHAAPDPTTAVAGFWRWWADGGARAVAAVLDAGTDDPAARQALAAELGERFAPTGLAWETGPGAVARHALVATTEGDRGLLDVAVAWLAGAPAEDATFEFGVGRRAVPDPTRFAVGVGGEQLAVADASVTVQRRGDGRTDVVVHHPGFAAVPHEVAGQVTFLLLDSLLGEHAVETRIGAIGFDAVPTADAVPLLDLRALAA